MTVKSEVVTAAAVRAVRQADALGAPLSLRRLAAMFPAADGRPRSTHWATGIKELAAAGPANAVSGRPRALSGLSVVPNSA
ncbi:hypothetical protein ACFO4E_12830 [Nocardiopsis mangrovi]|uniref:HTH HARE-type domain-containing protein n=1 Tax=Nocardiopsis mangrovi TaxID=1179818 RepID=A0ABV9DWI3_9ACTN